MSKEIPIDASSLSVALPDDHDVTKPFPLTIRRDFENPNCWATGDGSKVFRDREWAEKSMEMATPEYRERSRLRMEHSRLIKAEPVAWTDWVYADGYGHNEGYFDSEGELREWCADEGIDPPAYVFATREEGFDYDIFQAIDSYLSDDHHEDAHDQIVGWDELEAFWKAWVAKQTVKSYHPDNSKVVVIDQARYEAAIAVAKAWLAEHVPA